MADLETRLRRAFAEDAPPATDPLFRVQVILRRQHAQLLRQLVEVLIVACAGALLALLALQAVNEVVESTSARLVAAAIIALAYVLIFTQRCLGIPLFANSLSSLTRSAIRRY